MNAHPCKLRLLSISCLTREVKLEPELEDLFGDGNTGGADYQLQPRPAAPGRAQDTSYFDQPESYTDLPALPTALPPGQHTHTHTPNLTVVSCKQH